MNIKVEHFTKQVHILITVMINKVFQFIFHSFLIINLFNLTVLSYNNTKNEKNVHKCFNILIQSKKHVTLANTKIKDLALKELGFTSTCILVCSFHQHIFKV